MNEEIEPNGRIMVASGTGVPSAAQLAAMLAHLIPAGYEIDRHAPEPKPARIKEPETEIEHWNAAIERRKAERAERRASRK